MVTKSKLKMALAADKGTDYKKLHLKKKEKIARKSKKAKAVDGGDETKGKATVEEWEDVDEEDEDEGGVKIDGEEEESGSEEEADAPMKVCLLFTFGFLR